MEKRKSESFIPDVKKVLGDAYTVSLAVISGSVIVKKGEKTVIRIFDSINEHGFIVRVDDKSEIDMARKLADELKIKLVE